ncbi:MAG: molecular chaperone TorD family protein [Chloroflexi bacterium]|nr:molecular chaperone TorD family protein [Chloroflexota bacterium]
MNDLDKLLARSILFRWSARCFSYPDGPFTEEVRSGQAEAEMTAAAASLEASPALTETLDALAEALHTPHPGEPGLEEEYTFLFERSVRCPLYETSYLGEREPVLTHDLAEIAGVYAAFGVQVSGDHPERSDHLSLELDFMSLLCAKQAYAVEQGWKRRATISERARGAFIRDHLRVWFPSFADRLAQHARLGFYPAAARLTQALLDSETMLKGTGRTHHVLPTHA